MSVTDTTPGCKNCTGFRLNSDHSTWQRHFRLSLFRRPSTDQVIFPRPYAVHMNQNETFFSSYEKLLKVPKRSIKTFGERSFFLRLLSGTLPCGDLINSSVLPALSIQTQNLLVHDSFLPLSSISAVFSPPRDMWASVLPAECHSFSFTIAVCVCVRACRVCQRSNFVYCFTCASLLQCVYIL